METITIEKNRYMNKNMMREPNIDLHNINYERYALREMK